LHEALTASVHELEVTTVESAAECGMRGSPTILVDGVDPFAGASMEASLSCRLFETPDGVDGTPTVEQLIEAVTR
jgi:hypothetical protein